MAKDNAPEPLKIPKFMLPEGNITNEGRKGTGGTTDGQDHKTRRMVPALAIDGEDGASFLAAVEGYLSLNKALSVKGTKVLVKKHDGTEEIQTTKDPEDKGELGTQDGKLLIPCTGLPTTFADLVDSINKAVKALHTGDQNAWLTANFAPKKKKATEKALAEGVIPEGMSF